MAQATQLLRLARLRTLITSGEAKRIREAADVSIGEAARASGLSESTVWRWEQGHRRPRGESALAYADLLETLRR